MSHSIGLDQHNNKWATLTARKVCPSAELVNAADANKRSTRLNEVATDEKNKKESTSFYQVVDILSEGEVAGLCDNNGDLILLSNDINKNSDYFKGLYFDNNPVKNTKTNTYNYRTVFSEIRLGTEKQRALSDLNKGLSFAKASQTFNYGIALFANPHTASLNNVKINNVNFVAQAGEDTDYCYDYDTVISSKTKPNFAYSEFPFVHTVTNHNVDELVLNMGFTGQYNGKKGPFTVNTSFVIEVGYEGDSLSLDQGGSVGYLSCFIRGFASSEYIRSYHIPLPPSEDTKKRYIKITRVDKDFQPSFIQANKSLSVSSIVENIKEKLRYPNSSIMGNIFDASAFAQIPKRSFDLKLLKVNVPSNYDAEAKIYEGNWNGTFALSKKWTDNPAWILYDIMTNNRYGLGKYAFQQSMLDKWNLYSISKYCDELVPTGNTGLYPFDEFSVNKGSGVFKITINDNLSDLESKFELGSDVCFMDLKDGGTDIDYNYKGIIKKINIDGSGFKFEIIKDFGVEDVFLNYPDLKKQFLFNRSDDSKPISAKDFIKDIIINDNAQSYLTSDEARSFEDKYSRSYSLENVTSGYIVRQYLGELPILESRFTCNVVFNNRDEALNTINNIAAIFRGLTYWSEGLLFPSVDKPKDAVLMFNNSNVSSGTFAYTGSAKTSRTSSVVVRYNDANDNFKVKVAYAEDFPALREFGYNEQEVVAIGTTSASQAKRIAKWILYTNQTETDVVQFSTGQEGGFLLPGDIILIQDNFKTIKRYGGRIKDINFRDKTVTLDKGVSENIVNQKIYFMVPKANQSSKDLSNLAKEREGTSSDGVTDQEIDNQRTPQIKSFTVSSVSENNVITISEANDTDFNLITRGTIWSADNNDSGYNIKGIKYRVLSTEEKALNEFQVTAMMYNETKFNSLERGKRLEKTQQSSNLSFSVGDYPNETVSVTNDNGLVGANINDQIYDAYYTKERSDSDVKYEGSFSFQNLSEEVRGYIVDFSVLGKNLRFCLDGRDNTSFSVFLGNQSDLPRRMSYKVYVYDRDFKLELLL